LISVTKKFEKKANVKTKETNTHNLDKIELLINSLF